MKTTWDELMRYAPEQEYSLTPLEDSETERLLKRTMAKLNTTGKARKPQKFVRKFLLAAALAALLCVSVVDRPWLNAQMQALGCAPSKG